jgi:hypothetical protein
MPLWRIVCHWYQASPGSYRVFVRFIDGDNALYAYRNVMYAPANDEVVMPGNNVQ